MKTLTHTLCIAALLIAATIQPTAVQAQDFGSVRFGGNESTAAVVRPKIDETHEKALARANKQIRSGQITLGASALGMVGGVGMMLGGAARSICFGCDGAPTSGKALLAIGTIVGVVGLVGTISGAVVLRTGKKSKRALEEKRVQPEVRIGAGTASLKLTF